MTDCVTAEVVPVRTGVAKMKVPGLVNGVGGGDLMSGFNAEIEEAAVFLDDTGSVSVGPAVLASEPF